MAVVRDILEAIHQRRGGPNSGSDFFSTIDSYARTAQEIAALITPTNFSYLPGNVLRYGADPTGVVDATAAFNAATLSTLAAATIFTCAQEIVVPPGKYAINGTVYVRKGQRLRGGQGSYIVANNAGAGATFQMGWGLIAGVPTVDPGGQPSMIDNLFIFGGPAAGCVLINNIAGTFVKDLFITQATLGISIIGGSNDVNVSNIIFDGGATGVSLNAAFNCQLELLKFFNLNSDIVFANACYDCQFNDVHSEFNQFSTITFAAGSAGSTNIRFTDLQATYNAQFGTYSGTILVQSTSAVTASFDDFNFSNMPGYAYHGSATGSLISFSDGIFDGNRSSSGYAQSTLAGAINTANETVRIKNCTVRNCQGNGGANTPIVMGGTLVSNLEIDGGEYGGNFGPSFIGTNNSNAGSSIKVRNLQGDATQTLINNQSTVLVYPIRGCSDWFGPIATSGASHFVLVPYQFSNAYEITLRANINAGGGTQYRKITVTNVEKDNDFAAAAKSFLTTNVKIQGAANLNGLIATVVEFGAVGGGATIANSNSGSLAISWPNTYSSESIDVQIIL